MKKIAIALLLSGCTTVHIPPHSAASEWGVVHAESPEIAGRYADALADVAAGVENRLVDLHPAPVDLRIVGRIWHPTGIALPDGIRGASITTSSGSWIELLDRGPEDEQRVILAHEIAHSWLGPSWKPLSSALEDGLADSIGELVCPRGFRRQRLDYVLVLATVLGDGFEVARSGAPASEAGGARTLVIRSQAERGDLPDLRRLLEMDEAEVLAIQPDVNQVAVHAIGYLLASRIGADRLHALCLQASAEGKSHVPAEQLLAAAGIARDDPSSWSAAILGLYGADQRAQLVMTPWFIALWAARD